MAALRAECHLSAWTADKNCWQNRGGNALKGSGVVDGGEGGRRPGGTGEGGDGDVSGGRRLTWCGCLWPTIKLLMAVTVLHTTVCQRTVAAASVASSSDDVMVPRRLASYISVSNSNNDPIRPIFRPTANNITVSPGERAVLRCRVDNLGTKTVTWKKQNEVHPLTIGMHPFAPDSRISVDFNQRMSEWSLIIQDVGPMDEGVYQCQISTKNELDTYDIILNVKNILLSGTEYVERGGTIQLICNATGKPDPPHDVEWYRGDSNPIHSDARHGVIITKKIETKVLVSMLVISNSKLVDAGDYTCRSSGLDSATVTVHILNVAPPIDRRRTIPDRITGGLNKSNEVTAKDWNFVCLVAISIMYIFITR